MAEHLKQRAFSLLRKPAESKTARPSHDDGGFGGSGMDFSVKLGGKRPLPQARGEVIAHAAMAELKQEQAASGTHKQKVVMNLSLNGIKLTDEKSQAIIVQHQVKSISFITIDPDDVKWFSYIAAERPGGATKPTFMLYCFKSEKQAQVITTSMMRLFKVAYRRFKDSQKKPEQPVERARAATVSPGTGQTTTRTTVLRPKDDLDQLQEDPNYASLSSVQQDIPVLGGKRTSVSLIDFTALAEAPTPGQGQISQEDATAIYQVPRSLLDVMETKTEYATVNVGLKSGFTMATYGLDTPPMDDTTSLPAPVGVPFSGEVEFPFPDIFSATQPLTTSRAERHADPFGQPADQVQQRQHDAATETRPAGARQSTLLSFDPLTDMEGVESKPRTSSVGKGARPPIPPSRRDAAFGARNSPSRESTYYNTPRIPAVPIENAGELAPTALDS